MLIGLFLLSILIVFIIFIYFYYQKLKKQNIRKKYIFERIQIYLIAFFLIYVIIWWIYLPLFLDMHLWFFGLPFQLAAIILIIFWTFWVLQTEKNRQALGVTINNMYWESILSPVINQEIRKKSIRLGLSLFVVYLIILFSILIPTIIRYNEFWEEQGIGARSPIGSGAECCGVFLIILFLLIYSGYTVYLKQALKTRFFNKQRELINQGKDPMNIFLEDEVLQKYSIFCPRCSTMNIIFDSHQNYITCYKCKKGLPLMESDRIF